MIILTRKKNNSKGQTLVEFCLVVIIILILTIGAVDFARAFSTYQRMAAMGREGGRLFVKNTFDTLNLTTAALTPDVKLKVYDKLVAGMQPDDLLVNGGVIITVLRRDDGAIPTTVSALGVATGDDDDTIRIVHRFTYGSSAPVTKINKIAVGANEVVAVKEDVDPATPDVPNPVIAYNTMRPGEELVVVEMFYTWDMLTNIDNLVPEMRLNTLYDLTIF